MSGCDSLCSNMTSSKLSFVKCQIVSQVSLIHWVHWYQLSMKSKGTFESPGEGQKGHSKWKNALNIHSDLDDKWIQVDLLMFWLSLANTESETNINHNPDKPRL